MTALANGIHFNVSRADYDAIERVNWSTLKHLQKSPAHYRAAITSKQVFDSDEMTVGRATHVASYEPERFARSHAIWTGKVRNGKKWDEFFWDNCDKEILTANQHKTAVALATAVRRDPMSAPYFSGGKSEVTVLWTHVVEPVLGLPGYSIDLKCRLDWISNKPAIADLKTTADASPVKFGKHAFNLGYHMQAAMQVDGYFAATGIRLPYLWPVVETGEPHVVQVYHATPEVLELGGMGYRALLDKLNVCREDSSWPGYASSPMALELPRWALPTDDEILSGEGAAQ